MNRAITHLADVYVFRVEQVFVIPTLDRVYHSWLEIKQQCSRDVVVVISLIEEYVFSVISLRKTINQCGARLLYEEVMCCDRASYPYAAVHRSTDR